MDYEWYGHAYPVSAHKVWAVMKGIEDKDGEYTHQAFVDVSRPDESETHILFEWNDEIAGEKYRLYQASKIRSNLRLKIEKREPNEQKEIVLIPAFVNKEVDDNRTKARFVSVEKALDENSEYRKTVIRNAKKELYEFSRKYRIFSEFSDVIKAIYALNINT